MNRKVGVILSYVMMIFEVLSTLLLTPFIIRSLGDAEYGVYKLSASITAYLLLLDLGVGNAIVRYVSKYRANNQVEENKKFFGVSLSFYAIIALITLIIGVILYLVFPVAFSKGLNAEETALGQKLLIFTIINVAVTLGTATFPNIIIAYEKFAFQKGWSIVQILLKIIVTYAALKLGVKSLGIVIINLSLTVLTRGVFVLYVLFKIKLRPKFKNLDFTFVKEIFVYSSFILLQMVATQLNASLGQVLIGALASSSAVLIGIYGVGTQIVQYFQSIGSAFNGVLMPGVVKMVESKAEPSKLCSEMVRIGRIIFMILGIIFIVFVIFGKQFILLWVGDGYRDAYLVTILLMIPYLFTLTQAIGTQILWAKNQHKEQAILKVVIVLLNIVITVMLIYWKPLLGATIGTMLSLLLGDIVVMNVIFNKKIKISLLQYYGGLFKGILPCLVITILCGLLFSFLNLAGWFGFVINVAFMVVIYGVCMLLFGFNKYEKNLIKSIFTKKLKNKVRGK